MFISFNADEIHALRVELAEKLNAMPPEDAARMFREAVAREIEATTPCSLTTNLDVLKQPKYNAETEAAIEV